MRAGTSCFGGAYFSVLRAIPTWGNPKVIKANGQRKGKPRVIFATIIDLHIYLSLLGLPTYMSCSRTEKYLSKIPVMNLSGGHSIHEARRSALHVKNGGPNMPLCKFESLTQESEERAVFKLRYDNRIYILYCARTRLLEWTIPQQKYFRRAT